MPKKTSVEKEKRSDAIKNARVKKRATALISKYGIENITRPDEAVKEEIINREVKGFIASLKLKQDLNRCLKAESVYVQTTKPYNDAKKLLDQAEYYTHYEELEKKYYELIKNQ